MGCFGNTFSAGEHESICTDKINKFEANKQPNHKQSCRRINLIKTPFQRGYPCSDLDVTYHLFGQT